MTNASYYVIYYEQFKNVMHQTEGSFKGNNFIDIACKQLQPPATIQDIYSILESIFELLYADLLDHKIN